MNITGSFSYLCRYPIVHTTSRKKLVFFLAITQIKQNFLKWGNFVQNGEFWHSHLGKCEPLHLAALSLSLVREGARSTSLLGIYLFIYSFLFFVSLRLPSDRHGLHIT